MEIIPINHITRKPDSGQPMVAGRRIPVAVLIATIHNQPENTLEQIAENFDLTLGQVYAALSYYHDHKAEIEAIWREAKSYIGQPTSITADALAANFKARMAAMQQEPSAHPPHD